MQRSLRTSALLLFVAAASGCAAVRGMLDRGSPFPLWDFRAGMRFADLDAQAVREQQRAFACRPLVGSTQLCTVWGKAIGGRLRAVVDSGGTVIALQFAPREPSALMRDETHRMAAKWSEVVRGSAMDIADDSGTRGARGARGTRWRSKDGRWLAAMRFGALEDTPVSVTVTDAEAMTRLVESAPLAGLVLGLNGVLELASDEAIRDAVARPVGASAVTEVDLTATPADAAAPARTGCVALPPQLPLATGEARAALGEEMAALLERAVADGYPGARLLLADRAYLVDSTGAAEQVELGPIARTGDDLAVGVHFPRRADLARDGMTTYEPASQCDAGGVILVLHHAADPAARAARVVPDAQSPSARISALAFEESADSTAAPVLHVEYRAAYGTAQWRGVVAWRGLVALDPARVLMRVPVAFEKVTLGQPDSTAGDLFATSRSGDALQIWSVEPHADGFASRPVALPSSRTRLASGMTLLGGL